MEFSTVIPLYGNKNPNVRYFVHLENGKKKELKHDHDNIYYFCRDRKRTFVEVNGSLYHKQFKVIA